MPVVVVTKLKVGPLPFAFGQLPPVKNKEVGFISPAFRSVGAAAEPLASRCANGAEKQLPLDCHSLALF